MYPLPVYNGNTRARRMGPPRAFSFTQSNQPSLLFDAMGGTLVLGRGGQAPTFTRATVATITDQDLAVRQVLSGEVRFGGFRRVQNLCGTTSRDFNNAAWAKSNHTITTGIDDPFGGTAAFRLTRTSAAASWAGLLNTVAGNMANRTFRVTVWMRRAVGSAAVNLGASDVTTLTSNTAVTAALSSTTWKLISVLPTGFVTNTGSISTGLTLGADGDAVDIYGWRFTDVTGNSNQNPDEDVSVGVLSAPYQGANVDGVQYFPYLNGNTVASNVVTEATGAMISSSILGGYLPEPAATNLCLQSETLDVAGTWPVTAATVSANATTAPTGLVTADKIQEDNTTAVHTIQQAFVKAASAITYTTSAYFKQAERTWAFMQVSDGVGNGIRVWVNLATGALGSNTALGAGWTFISAEVVAAANGFYRLKVAHTSNAAVSFTISLCTSTGDTVASYLGTTGSGVYGFGIQHETGNQIGLVNSYIPTVGASVTRNADVLTYATTGWLNAAAGTLYGEFFNITVAGAGSICAAINDATINNYIDVRSTGGTGSQITVVTGGAAQSVLTGAAITAGAVAKMVNVYQANDFAGYANNNSAGTDAAGTIPTVTRMEIGSVAGGNQLGHYVRKCTYYPVRLPNSIAQSLTV